MKSYRRIPNCLLVAGATLVLWGAIEETVARGIARASVARPSAGGNTRSNTRANTIPNTIPNTRPNTIPNTRPNTRPNTGANVPSRLPSRPPVSSVPGSAWDRMPGVSRPVPSYRPAVRPAVRPAPIVRPSVPRVALPANLRAGTVQTRYAAVRTTTRAAFARPMAATTLPARTQYLTQRTALAKSVRTSLAQRTAVMFTPSWWLTRKPLWNHCRWHYLHTRPATYWWGWATWSTLNNWVVYDYSEPWEYEYNYNVVFDEDAVFINEEPVATAEDYIEIGEELAGDPLPDTEAKDDWLPLGVFAIATSDSDRTPEMLLQLVMSKDGKISGSYYHWETQSLRMVHGSVDKETQRVAFLIGEGNNNVVEVGLAGLAEDETPMWVHFGGERTQTWTLIRIEPSPSMKKELDQLGEGGRP